MLKKLYYANLGKIASAFRDTSYRRVFVAIILFIFMNAFKLTLYNYFLIPEVAKGMFAYKLGFSLLCSIIIFSIVLSFKSKYVFLLVMVAQGIYCFTNISYFLYYHSYLHFLQWISLFKEALISATHLANPKSAQLLVVFIDAPLALYIFFKYFKAEVKKHSLPLLKYTILFISIAILFFIEVGNYKDNRSVVQYMDDRYTGETEIVERYGTLVNSAVNIIKNYSETKLIEQIKYGRELTDGDLKKLQKDKGTSEVAMAAKPNFVLIQVESMDSNIVRQKYKEDYVMPYLNSLSNDAIYYPYTLSYHQGGGTSDTEFSVINSVEPLDSFPAIKLTSYNYPNSVVSKLLKASYETMVFHGNVGTFYNRNIALSKMGFNNFYDINSMNYEDEGWGAPDDKVFSFAFDKISKTKKPFLTYVITMTSHGPFESARNYYSNPAYDDIENELVRNYYNSFSYVDKSIEAYVKDVQNKYPNTYFFIYGDHTPNINSADFAQSSFIEGDKYFEFVPLYIITPDKRKYVESKAAASFLDIGPTILDASGIPFRLYSDGSSLLRRNSSLLNIPLKGDSFNRNWLYEEISNYEYSEAEPIWMKYLPSFISSNLIEKHK